MYKNRLKNKKVFIGAGSNDLEVFNSDGEICSLKMINNFAVNIIGINVVSSIKDLPMCCEILIFRCFEVIPIYDAEHSLQVYL